MVAPDRHSRPSAGQIQTKKRAFFSAFLADLARVETSYTSKYLWGNYFFVRSNGISGLAAGVSINKDVLCFVCRLCRLRNVAGRFSFGRFFRALLVVCLADIERGILPRYTVVCLADIERFSRFRIIRGIRRCFCPCFAFCFFCPPPGFAL